MYLNIKASPLMIEQNIVAAVDFGTNTVTCLIGKEIGKNKVEILGHSMVASASIRRGVVLNINEAVGAVKKAVEKATLNLDVVIKKLYVNVAGQKLRTIERQLSRNIEKGELITKVDVMEMYEEARSTRLDEGDKVYHVINQSYAVDDETGIHNPIGSAGRILRAEYRLIIGPDSYEAKIKTSLERAGFEMVKCVVNPVAAGEAVLTNDEKEAGVVVLDMGGGTTSISIYYDSVLRHIGMIPFGGNVVTNDIKEGCGILLRQAESLKVQYGEAMGEYTSDNKVVTIPGINGGEHKEISFKSLAYIIQARMEEIIESVYYQIQKSNFADLLGAGIVITGGGAKLNGLLQLVLFKTGMEVRIGHPINIGSCPNDRIIEDPQYATAFGLLKKALNDANAQNDDLIVEKKKKKVRVKNNYGEAFIQRLALFFNDEQDAEF
jgi:cell division protein FtsA